MNNGTPLRSSGRLLRRGDVLGQLTRAAVRVAVDDQTAHAECVHIFARAHLPARRARDHQLRDAVLERQPRPPFGGERVCRAAHGLTATAQW